MIYVLVDGKWHEQTDEKGDGLTACGLEVPHGSPWARDLDDEACADCFPKDEAA